RLKLMRDPAYDRSDIVWDCACINSIHFCKHLTVGIALDIVDRDRKVAQTSECFARHWTYDHITSDHELINVYLSDILQDCLKSGKVAVNVVECSNTHDRPFWRRQ